MKKMNFKLYIRFNNTLNYIYIIINSDLSITPRFENKPDIGFFPTNLTNDLNPLFEPDWTSDFSEKIDIE